MLKYHSLQDRVASGIIELVKVDTRLNAVDIMTKNVGVGTLKVCKQLAGMVDSGYKLSMVVDGCCWEGECGRFSNIFCISMM